MDESQKLQIDAQVSALAEQRNNAMNQVVNLVGELARVNNELNKVQTKLNELTTEGPKDDVPN